MHVATYHYRLAFAISLIPRPCGRREHWPGYESSSPYLHTLTLLMQPNGTLSLAARPQLSTLDTWNKKITSFLALFAFSIQNPWCGGLKPHTHTLTHTPSPTHTRANNRPKWKCCAKSPTAQDVYMMPLHSTCTHVYMQHMFYMLYMYIILVNTLHLLRNSNRWK